jgi:riboflavin transporter 2
MIGAVSQLAQIGPILLLLMKCKCVSCCSNSFSRCLRKGAIPDRAIVYGLLIIGMIAGTCLALFWDKTMIVFGQTRSYVFFICVFFLAILDCTCTIAFLTYIGGFRGDYVTALYIGEGISSLLPSLFALLQGTGDSSHECFNSNNSTFSSVAWSNATTSELTKNKPRFSISTYFWLLLSTLIVSFLAFLVLEFYPGFRKEHISKHPSSATYRYSIDSKAEKQESPLIKKRKRSTTYKAKQSKKTQNLDKFVLFTAIMFISFVLYGILPALSSYSAMPYGSKIMHLSSSFALISQPISSMFATFFRIKSTSNMIKLLIFTTFLSSYIVMASFMSPCPPFKHLWFSGYLMVKFLFYFQKTYPR